MLMEDGVEKESRTEKWANLIKSKSFDEEDQGPELVAKRSVVFGFEIAKACAHHSIKLHLQENKPGKAHPESLWCADWKLGRLVSPGDGSFVSSYRDKPKKLKKLPGDKEDSVTEVDMGLVTDKGIDLRLGKWRSGSDSGDSSGVVDPDYKDATIGLSLVFLPWDAAAEPCVLVTVHKAKDLPFIQGYEPPDSYCKMHSEFRQKDPEQSLTELKHPDDTHYPCPSKLPHIDRDPRCQEKMSRTIKNELNPEYEKKFLFYVNREMLDSRHFKEQIIVLQVFQEGYDTSGNKGPAKEVGYHAVSVRKIYFEHANAKRAERKAMATATEEEKKKLATASVQKQLWRIRETTEESKQYAPDTARGAPYSTVQVSLSFLGDWSHANEEADEELDEKMLKYMEEQRQKAAKEAAEKAAKEQPKGA